LQQKLSAMDNFRWIDRLSSTSLRSRLLEQ